MEYGDGGAYQTYQAFSQFENVDVAIPTDQKAQQSMWLIQPVTRKLFRTARNGDFDMIIVVLSFF